MGTFQLISVNACGGEHLNQMQKEILIHFEHIQDYVVQEHHHQKGQTSYHGPAPGGQEGVNSICSVKK